MNNMVKIMYNNMRVTFTPRTLARFRETDSTHYIFLFGQNGTSSYFLILLPLFFPLNRDQTPQVTLCNLIGHIYIISEAIECSVSFKKKTLRSTETYSVILIFILVERFPHA